MDPTVVVELTVDSALRPAAGPASLATPQRNWSGYAQSCILWTFRNFEVTPGQSDFRVSAASDPLLTSINPARCADTSLAYIQARAIATNSTPPV